MANTLYPKFKEALLSGDIDLAGEPVLAMLVDTSEYAFDPAHDALNDVPADARIGDPQALDDKTITDGVFNAAEVTFTAVPAGGVAGAIVIFAQGASEAQSRLVAFFDTVGGLPITPNTGDLIVEWDAAAILYL
ncbi:hypothetical protein FPY71_07280 [Aureimonas fodinaquatilis]|uniref:Uncharacterized protein n=1 Tax=Aureimonas fodinaquatilis TaxID=2565783 RepID=A0A5B0DYP6_9HYPH|nr:hypothetical protein [Aureimonas fodinaquatilis]KAA0970319.1 hypothetical protein FPY71_07280 [Aureimonas fodinaquatilis]